MKKINLLFRKSLAMIAMLLLVLFTFQIGNGQYSLGMTVSQLTAQTGTGNGSGFCPGPAINITDCDCPTGFVAVGYEGLLGNSYGGNVISQYSLHCKQLMPDGSLGATTSVTCSNGSLTTGTLTGPFLSSGNNALVGAQQWIGCAIDRVQGYEKSIIDIAAGSPNSTSSTITGLGAITGNDYPIQYVPDGFVIVGMSTYEDQNPPGGFNVFGITAGTAWRYAEVLNTTPPPPTVCGNGLDFDGADDQVSTNYAGVLGNTDRTFEAWVYVPASAPASNLAILDYGLNAVGSRNTFQVGGNRAVRFISGGTNANLASAANVVPDDQWTHVAFVLDNGTGFLYVDGAQVATGNLTTVNTPAGNESVKIGQRVAGGSILFNGIIDEVRIWDDVRTAAEIVANMGTEICDPTVEANLQLYLPFNEGVAGGNNAGVTTATDLSSNAYTGTLQGFALNGPTSNWVEGVPCDLLAQCNQPGACDLSIVSIVTPPNFICGDNGTINITATSSNPPITYSISGPVSQTNNTGSFSGLPAGAYSIHVYDAFQGPPACEATGVAFLAGDTEAPVITCPPGQIMSCFESVPPSITNINDFIAAGGTYSDNCPMEGITVFSQSTDNNGSNCPGDALMVTRTYYVQDAAGNTTTCDQVFTYLESTQGPVITSVLPTCYKYCASLANPMESDITYNSDCSFGATTTITGPTQIGADNCPGTIYRYTYIVTDDCGRTSLPVTRDFVIGNNGPEITCAPFNLILECGDPNNDEYIATHLSQVNANTACELGVNITNNFTGLNFGSCTNSSKVVTFTATDDCGRTATCTTTITIQDNTAPDLTSTYIDGICNEAICGSNVSFWFNEWMDKVEDGLSATDACDNFVTFTTIPSNPSANQDCPDNEAETVVTWVANDNCGNTTTIQYSFYVVPAGGATIAGMVHTEMDEAVQDVEVSLTGGNNFFELFVTANDGNYNFDNVPMFQNYQIDPYHNQFPLNGVSSFDMVLIAQHILGMNQLDSPYKMIAADINKSGQITTLDILELRKLILFIETDFPNNTSWRFVDGDFVFPFPTNPFATAFPELVSINGLLENVTHDFVGVKIGDVNNTAVPNNLLGGDDRSFNGDLNFNVNDKELEAGETYEVVFTSDNFEEVAGYQYTLNFDATQLAFVDVQAGDLPGMDESNFGLSLLEEGAITTSWTNREPVSVAADVELFRITFKAKSDVTLSEALQVSSRYTEAEAYDVNTENGQLNLLNVDLRFDELATERTFALMQNTPNPFVETTSIGFILPEATAATLTILDVSGRVLKVIEGEYEAGYNVVQLDRSDLSEGMLYYRLETATDQATMKLLLINN